jgi:hypothetical protein
MNKFLCSAFVLASAVAGAATVASSQAKADVVWTLHNVVFDDGGKVADGTFTVNNYGYLVDSAISVTTTAGTTDNGTGGPLAGDLYNADMAAGNINNFGAPGQPNEVTFFSSTLPAYDGTLNLEFQYALTQWRAVNPIIGGSSGPSWECSVGFDCPNVVADVTTAIRYVGTDGYAAATAAPELPVWAMLMVGVGLMASAKPLFRRLQPRTA